MRGLPLAAAALAAAGLSGAAVETPPSPASPLAVARYVAPGGSDAGDGSLASPWATLQHAADVMQPGETVYVRGGTYRQKVRVTRSGRADAWLTFAAHPGEAPVIDAAGIVLGEGLNGVFHVLQAAYVRVTGLRVAHAGPGDQDCGFLLENSQHLALERNVTDDTASSGIGVWGCEDVTLDGNEVIRACHGGIQEQVSVGGTSDFRVVNTRVHDAGGTPIGGEGICLKDGSHGGWVHGNEVWNVPQKVGIYVDAWDKHTYDVRVDGNLVHDCKEGIGLASEMGGLLERISVTNNVCVGNSLRGLFTGDYGGVATHPMNDLLVANNTFARNGTSGWGGGMAFDSREERNVVVRNNVVSANHDFTIVVSLALPSGAVSVDHNLVDGFTGYEGAETRGTAYVEGDPRFVNAVARDLRLAADSPAIDRGSAERAPAADFDGVARPQGAGFDIGAFERPAAATSETLFVPVVLRTSGLAGSYFTSELTLANRGAGSAAVRLDYTGLGGSPAGSATAALAPGRQLVIPDAIAWLAAHGVAIPDGNAVGTLRATFTGLTGAADAAALVRTTTPVPPGAPTGSAGLSYAGVPLAALPSGPVFLGGLRSDARDRANVALQNAGAPGEGDVTLRLTLSSGFAQTVTLAPGGFAQSAVPDGFSGTATVERVSGSAPFYAYGVVNDGANSDGSFVPPLPLATLGGAGGVTLPVVVEASVFTSEVVVANTASASKRVRMSLWADALGASPAALVRDVAAGAQLVVPEFVAALRAAGASVPSPVVGPLVVTVDGGATTGLFVGARTGSPGGGGRYALFYTGISAGGAHDAPVWLIGLQQTAATRTNLAIVNTGETDGSADGFLVELFDGATGAKAGETALTVGARRQAQLDRVLGLAPGVTQGYARVTRTSGTNPFVAYAVLNDGAAPGERSGDGAWVTSD